MKKNLGGFFEKENNLSGNKNPHSKALFLNTGRGCLNVVIQSVKPKRIFVPFFTCDALLQPIVLNNIPFTFYKIDENLDPLDLPPLENDEWLIYINYFGVKNKAVEQLVSRFGHKLIIDNTQAFLEGDVAGNYSFNSARKYFGVPDGAYLYSPQIIENAFEINSDIQVAHLELRSEGKQVEAFSIFKDYESRLDSNIKCGSNYSGMILDKIDYDHVASKRRNNFNEYHKNLKDFNTFPFDENLQEMESFIPFSYPFKHQHKIKFEKFYQENIFLPVYWIDVLERSSSDFSIEKDFTLKTAHLPVDHRYDKDDIRYIVKKLKEIIL